ncbi:hypothetical protein PTSG_01282 [Salpingoeca rosetta]|uniref:Aspartyl/asparaginy/proline hydroxylase domain-containing protein n=1 Tax=Salpingoeca rosetta (strain ATCC 50818 / BSB-021) TaxID=946362 RepID=F2TZW4_SALR5|nr:uncharacterized protein PTSG_01282 [Salpingoeca rosetta]EGD80692.1 hypothetical protein PTSG_01282 [Salpingoeca rosetta]|eukprot:XP_004997253.1 hypothetical protein PTSG_01282 [Salpingoeca rosetta]
MVVVVVVLCVSPSLGAAGAPHRPWSVQHWQERGQRAAASDASILKMVAQLEELAQEHAGGEPALIARLKQSLVLPAWTSNQHRNSSSGQPSSSLGQPRAGPTFPLRPDQRFNDMILSLLPAAINAHVFELAAHALCMQLDAFPEQISTWLDAGQLLQMTGRTSQSVLLLEALVQHHHDHATQSDIRPWQRRTQLQDDAAYALHNLIISYAHLRDEEGMQRAFRDHAAFFRVPWPSPTQIPMHYAPSLTAKPFHNPRAIPDLVRLEAAFPAILDELTAYLQQHTVDTLRADHGLAANDGDWTEVLLWDSGQFTDKCAHFGHTCDVLQHMPMLTGQVEGRWLSGQATIFRLAPGAHLRAHTGSTNTRLTAHLGLIVPPGPQLIVNNTAATWEAGKVILFDDSFIHEVYHFGTEPRYVLYCSVWHPDIARAHQLLTNNGS